MRKTWLRMLFAAVVIGAVSGAAADDYDALRNTIATSTDPVEFGRALNTIFDAFRLDCIIGAHGSGPVCDTIRQLDQQWRDRREAVAKANQGCKKHAKAIVARDIESMIGAPGKCAYIALGIPKDVNRTTTAQTVHDQWVYPGIYVYVDDGIITAVQR